VKVLVTGASGLLGAHLMAALSADHAVTGIDRNPWWGDGAQTVLLEDLFDAGATTRIVREEAPDAVIHCAAMTDVDACERNPSLALRANTELTRELAGSVGRSCLFVFISTDGVFTGTQPFAAEDWPPDPQTVYGRTKLEAEGIVKALPNHLVIRTNFFGWSSGRKKTSAEWLFGALRAQEPITLFDDFFFTPIYVVDFVTALVTLMSSSHRGLFHVCGSERVSKYDFGIALAQLAGFQASNVTPGSIRQARLAAPRPPDMSLNSDKLHRLAGIPAPSIMDGLRAFLGDRDRPLSQHFTRPRS